MDQAKDRFDVIMKGIIDDISSLSQIGQSVTPPPISSIPQTSSILKHHGVHKTKPSGTKKPMLCVRTPVLSASAPLPVSPVSITSDRDKSPDIDMDELFRMLSNQTEQEPQRRSFVDVLVDKARLRCEGRECNLALESIITDENVRTAIQRLWIINNNSSGDNDGTETKAIVPHAALAVGKPLTETPETAALLKVVGESPEYARMIERGMVLRYFNGKLVVGCDVHKLFVGQLVVTRAPCDQRLCTYVSIVDLPRDVTEATEIYRRLVADGYVVNDTSVDPEPDDLWVCVQHGRFHDCRPHMCAVTVSDNGANVCMFTGRSHGQVICAVDPDRNVIAQAGVDDESHRHMSGHMAVQLSEDATSRWNARVAITSDRAATSVTKGHGYLTVIQQTPWHAGEHRAQQRLDQIQRHVTPTISTCSSLTTLREALDNWHSEWGSGKGNGSSSTSMANREWDVGPAENRRRGGTAADKRTIRPTVLLDPDTSVEDGTNKYALSNVIDVPWLQRIAELFDCEEVCRPYITIAGHSPREPVPPECEFIVSELHQITQILNHMLVNIPATIERTTTTRATKRDDPMDIVTTTVTTTTMSTITQSSTASSLQAWRSRLVIKYTTVAIRSWVLCRISRVLVGRTHDLTNQIETGCIEKAVIPFASTISSSSSSPAPITTTSSRPILAICDDPVHASTDEAPIRLNHCVIGTMYLLKTGFMMLAEFAPILSRNACVSMERAVVANTTRSVQDYPMAWCVVFAGQDVFVESYLIDETSLASAKQAIKHTEVKEAIESELCAGARAAHVNAHKSHRHHRGKKGNHTKHKVHVSRIHIDCQVAANSQVDMKCQFGKIGVWCLVKFAHDVLCGGVPFQEAEALYQRRIDSVCINK